MEKNNEIPTELLTAIDYSYLFVKDSEIEKKYKTQLDNEIELSIKLSNETNKYNIVNQNISSTFPLTKKEFDILTNPEYKPIAITNRSGLISLLAGSKGRMNVKVFRALFLLYVSNNKILFDNFKNKIEYYPYLLEKIDNFIKYIINPKTKRIMNHPNNKRVYCLAIQMNTRLYNIIKNVLSHEGNILIELNYNEILIKKYKLRNIDDKRDTMMFNSIEVFWNTFIYLTNQ